jgi:undecaprenyl-diphosphatase
VNRGRLRTIGVGLFVAAFCVVASPSAAWATTVAQHVASNALTAFDAIVLGIVEGVTEFLPISSTGHLLITGRILDLPSHGKAGDAVKSYEIAIQFGAILAVLVLYWARVRKMFDGLIGRDEEGRRLVSVVAIAFVPAAIVGVLAEKVIKDVLFGSWPVIAAWIVGGIAILVLSRAGVLVPTGGRALEAVTPRDGLLIGAAQVLALWPGTSRSLVTILAAVLLGLSMAAAVEFSFLLGLVTLTAATGYEFLSNGKLMLDTFGLGIPLLGLAVAFVAAVVSVRWMVTYLRRHDFSIFGWYRIGVAVLVIVLIATNAI